MRLLDKIKRFILTQLGICYDCGGDLSINQDGKRYCAYCEMRDAEKKYKEKIREIEKKFLLVGAKNGYKRKDNSTNNKTNRR